MKNNYLQVGRMIECGACHPEKYKDCEEIEKQYGKDFKCECICHDKTFSKGHEPEDNEYPKLPCNCKLYGRKCKHKGRNLEYD